VGDDLAEHFRRFADSTRSRAPLYARLAEGIADDPRTSRLLLHAPPTQRQPVLLFAAVHALLLDDPEAELRRWYPNLTEEPPDTDPYPAFVRYCEEHEPQLAGLLATKNTQTNEVGRCAVFLPVLGQLAAAVGPLTLVDVGTSAGLNLLLDRYEYVYEPGGTVGGGSPVVLRCGTRGAVPVPAAVPAVVDRVGLDQAPVDVRDREAARWLEACVWPDQADRFDRLRRAIDIAQQDPPALIRGDAIADVGTTIESRTGGGHPVVLNSWVLSYLTTEDRTAYVDALDAVGARRDLSWVALESPSQTSGLPWPTSPIEQDRTVVLVTTWRAGRREVREVAAAHPHGFWLHWGEPALPG
jgi:hypothetical protein